MSDSEFRHAALELRAEARQLVGLALPYERETTHRGRREMFARGSASSTGDAILNLFHDNRRPVAREPDSLSMEQRDDGLYLTATLPETTIANDALSLVESRIIRGLSVEFRAARERMIRGVRVIEAAEIRGVGLVPRAAYQTHVEARGLQLASALASCVQSPEIEAAATAAGVTVEQLRRVLAALGEIVPESPSRRSQSDTWML